MDEIGVPFFITVDHNTVLTAEGEDGGVTVRERDSGHQVRVPRAEVVDTVMRLSKGRTQFADLLEKYERVR